MGLASSISSGLEKKTFTPSRRVGAGVGLDVLASVKWTSSGHNRTIFYFNVLHAMLFSRLVAECSPLCIGISGTENRVSCCTQIVEFRQKAVPLCLKYSATKGKRPGQLSAVGAGPVAGRSQDRKLSPVPGHELAGQGSRSALVGRGWW
jgi:hypothetical protein